MNQGEFGRVNTADMEECKVANAKESYKVLHEYRAKNQLCKKCGEPLDNDSPCCNSCISKQRGYLNKFVNMRKEKNRCVLCNKPIDREGAICKKCCISTNEKHRKTQKTKRLLSELENMF